MSRPSDPSGTLILPLRHRNPLTSPFLTLVPLFTLFFLPHAFFFCLKDTINDLFLKRAHWFFVVVAWSIRELFAATTLDAPPTCKGLMSECLNIFGHRHKTFQHERSIECHRLRLISEDATCRKDIEGLHTLDVE